MTVNNEQSHNRADDSFFRKVIWYLIAATTGSLGGWIWTIAVLQTTVTEHSEKINDLEEYNRNIIEMRVILQDLVSESKETNALLREVATEQQVRSPVIRDARDHMKNRHIHK